MGKIKVVMTKAEEDRLIELWNCQKYSLPAIAKQMDMKVNVVKNTISRLRKYGLVYPKNTGGKLIIPKEAIRETDIIEAKEKNVGLEDLMSDIMNVSNTKSEISVAHKEMLIEILHRII